MTAIRPTSRFSDRVDDYVRSRPSYPPAVLDVLRREINLREDAVIADIGSGTGISAGLFLAAGHQVFGVEPNAAMRAAAEAAFAAAPRFHTIDGTAEATTLEESSVDLVVAAQAFHWFDVDATRREFARILRPDGSALLMWNTRRTDDTPFLRAYEAMLLAYATDYREVDHRRVDPARLSALFGHTAWVRQVLPHAQVLDRSLFRARTFSSSYTPSVDHPRRAEMIEEVDRLFAAHQNDGAVVIAYDTEIYVGPVVD